MSGRTKKIIYHIVDLLLFMSACAGAILIEIFEPKGVSLQAHYYAGLIAFLSVEFLRLNVFCHELGHLLFGLFAGMTPISFTVGAVTVSKRGIKFDISNIAAGATVMLPKRSGHMRGRALALTLGGGIFALLLGGIGLALYFCLDYSPVTVYFAVFSCFVLYEGLRAFLPAELPAGKTDGAVAWGLMKKSAEEEVMLRVYEIQGILYRGEFTKVPEEAFTIPVVREDLPAFRVLLFMKMQKILSEGEQNEARRTLERLQELSEYFSEDERKQAERYALYFDGKFEINKKEPMHGVRELEKSMKKTIAERANEK